MLAPTYSHLSKGKAARFKPQNDAGYLNQPPEKKNHPNVTEVIPQPKDRESFC